MASRCKLFSTSYFSSVHYIIPHAFEDKRKAKLRMKNFKYTISDTTLKCNCMRNAYFALLLIFFSYLSLSLFVPFVVIVCVKIYN
jgi:hypothetical protein